MCIRDRTNAAKTVTATFYRAGAYAFTVTIADPDGVSISSCLLYTSDAADERSSVDLGGRRIIKKKKNTEQVAEDGIK